MATAAAPRFLDLSPIQFKVRTPIFFRGEPIKAGTIIDAEASEAVELFGNVRCELVNKADWERIRDLSQASSADLYRAAQQANRGWVRQHNRI